MNSRTASCTPATVSGRLAKARSFAEACAKLTESSIVDSDFVDASVTLAIHASIAAADVICCAKLGRYSSDREHAAAARLLAAVDPNLGTSLGRLLELKSAVAYGNISAGPAELKRSLRVMRQLLEAAERAIG